MFSVKRTLFICLLSLLVALTFTSLAFAADFTVDQPDSDKADIALSKSCYNHEIISEKPLYLKDADTDTWYENVNGKVLLKWNSEVAKYSLLDANLQVADKLSYQFELVCGESSSDDSVIGFFNIKRNGKLVASQIHGQLYGLNAAVGEYFKFYSDDFNWHFSAYVTYRNDYASVWNHQIISDKPLYLKEADNDKWYENVKGNVLIEWDSKIQKYGFLNANLQVDDKLNYQFELVSAESSTEDSIIGIFNIKKNGKLVASGIHGQLYGLNAAVGDYFKFYSDDFNWHFSAYVTSRIDK